MARCRTHSPRSAAPVPLRSADHASDVIAVVASRPLAAETICLLVDEAYLPVVCVVVDGGGEPDDVLDVVDLVEELARSGPTARVAIASCRPGRGFEPADLARWQGITAALDDADVELLEWFIRDEDTMVAVSALADAQPSWPAGGAGSCTGP